MRRCWARCLAVSLPIITPSRSGLRRSRKKSAAMAISRCVISPPPRPMKPPCWSNSAPARRRCSRRRNRVAARRKSRRYQHRAIFCGLDRLPAVPSNPAQDRDPGGDGLAAPACRRDTKRGRAVAMAPAGRADTFPKLLVRNAEIFCGRPAFRLKDFGIWQTWTWEQVLAEVRAYAAGLHRLGLKPNDAIAIVGSNRPKLYWSVTAAQMLRAVPVPVYGDAVADELAYVLAHAEVKFAAVEDQEQVDKILSISERLPKLARVMYDEPRGLRDYDHGRLNPIDDVIHDGRAALTADAALGRWLDDEIAAGTGKDVSIILYTSGTTGTSKGVVLSALGCINAASDTVAFDRLTDRDEALAYLPLAWVGDHYLNYAQGMVAGFCMACPESGETVMQDLREIGPTFYFAPPRVFEQMLTSVMIRMEDAAALKRHLFHYFSGGPRR